MEDHKNVEKYFQNKVGILPQLKLNHTKNALYPAQFRTLYHMDNCLYVKKLTNNRQYVNKIICVHCLPCLSGSFRWHHWVPHEKLALEDLHNDLHLSIISSTHTLPKNTKHAQTHHFGC